MEMILGEQVHDSQKEQNKNNNNKKNPKPMSGAEL
jgi:hypothetical protein